MALAERIEHALGRRLTDEEKTAARITQDYIDEKIANLQREMERQGAKLSRLNTSDHPE